MISFLLETDLNPELYFRVEPDSGAVIGCWFDAGEAYLPGDSANSPIVHYVAGTDENILMPPEGEGAQEVAD